MIKEPTNQCGCTESNHIEATTCAFICKSNLDYLTLNCVHSLCNRTQGNLFPAVVPLHKINVNAVSGSPKPQESSQISMYNAARLPLKLNIHMLLRFTLALHFVL